MEPALKPLHALIQDLPIRVAAGPAEPGLTGITDDSRRVTQGMLFIARVGTATDGARYIKEAAHKGALAVLSAAPAELPNHVTQLIGDDPGALTAELAERFYDRPSKKLKLIGVTGTNGKTTVAYMTRHLLSATGHKCGMMTTVEVDDGSAKPQAAELTTPGACEISATLARMVENGCEACVMEASSHALDQGRCAALDFDLAVFTNLSGDHLDYHQTMEAYAAAKAKLFEPAANAVVNLDDEWAGRIADLASDDVFGYTLGPVIEGALWNAEVVERGANGTRLVLEGYDDEPVALTLPLLGEHNTYNLLAAVAVANLFGHSLAQLKPHIESMPQVAGRLERVSEDDAAFTVLVDYAHTDDALRNVLEALKPLMPGGAQLRVLFGCGGDRDKTKRPRMAAVACELADAVVVTSDNPRTEDPAAIIDDVMAGVPRDKAGCVQRITDRREAIEKIIADANTGDIVLLAGKGHEDYQIIGTEKRPFDDRAIAREVIAGQT